MGSDFLFKKFKNLADFYFMLQVIERGQVLRGRWNRLGSCPRLQNGCFLGAGICHFSLPSLLFSYIHTCYWLTKMISTSFHKCVQINFVTCMTSILSHYKRHIYKSIICVTWKFMHKNQPCGVRVQCLRSVRKGACGVGAARRERTAEEGRNTTTASPCVDEWWAQAPHWREGLT